MINRSFKIVGRDRHTQLQVKKRVYTSVKDFLSNKDQLISRYLRCYGLVEVYELIEGKWIGINPDTVTPENDLNVLMERAGMIPIAQLLSDDGSLNMFAENVHINNLEDFHEWLQSRAKEFLELQATLELKKNDDHPLFEWALAHAAVFREVLMNFRRAMRKENDVGESNTDHNI